MSSLYRHEAQGLQFVVIWTDHERNFLEFDELEVEFDEAENFLDFDRIEVDFDEIGIIWVEVNS